MSLENIIPEPLKEGMGLEKWAWVDGLIHEDEPEGVLTKVEKLVTSDVEKLEEARVNLIQQKKPSDFILKVINNIQRTYLINFLSRQNVIPKYGFPVDVVNLQILHHADEARGLELDRDLRIALAEYAPSGQIVAGGKLWTSRYLKRLPDRGWKKYRYAICEYCQCYQRVWADTDEKLDMCIACHQPLSGKDQGVFVIPEFGFITTTRPPAKPGDSRPERTYTTRTYFSGKSKESDTLILDVGKTQIVVVAASEGELAVINHAGYQGFKVCPICGYTRLMNEKVSSTHTTPWLTECTGTLTRLFLGHEFKTDISQLRFEGYANADRGFWWSLLYAVLEGMSMALDIDRQDLDGCLYAYAGDPSTPALVLFDDVPGGAGHVRRIIQGKENLQHILEAALERLSNCDCGGERQDTSCYGCLRNYRNQFCHDEMKRGPVIKFLSTTLGI
jgi:hypothetical protein